MVTDRGTGRDDPLPAGADSRTRRGITGAEPNTTCSRSAFLIVGSVRWERALLFGLASIIPTVVIFLIVMTFWTSFVDGVPGKSITYTFKNYVAIYVDPFTVKALVNTLWFTVTATAIAIMIGLPIAWCAERTTLPGKPLLYGLMVLGVVIPGFFVAIGWILMLHPRIGFVNIWLRALTGSPDYGLNITTLGGMGFVQGLSLAPLAFVMTAAAFRAMNPILEEAAHVHGMTAVAILRRITLPLVFPAIAAATIYIFVIGIAAFDIPAIMGLANRIYTFSTFLYQKAINPDDIPNYGIPSAVGLMMFISAIAITLWYSRFLRVSERYEVVSGKSYTVKRTDIGRTGNRITWAFCVVFFLLTIGIPLLLIVWVALVPYVQPPSLRAVELLSFAQFEHLDWDLVLRAGGNTVLLMALVPTVTVVLALPIAWVVVRSGSRWRYVYEFLCFLPHAMPPIIFAIAALMAVLFVVGDAVSLYGTIWLIAIVYVIESIAFVSRVLNSALIQLHRELEEVGYVSGLGPMVVLRRLFVPLLLPAILGVWLWRALVTYRELTVATTLYTPDNITLPVLVWNIWTSGGTGQAAAMTLVIVGVLTPIIMLYWVTVGRRFLGW